MTNQYRYIIEGDLVRQERIQTMGALRLKDLLPLITTYSPLELCPLPNNTVYISTSGSGDTIEANLIVQQNPRIQRINYKNAHIYADGEVRNFALPMPFTLFWFAMTGTLNRGTRGETRVWAPKRWGAMWAQAPIKDINSRATYMWMPNCYTNTRVCFGTNNVNARQSLGEYVDSVVNTFWLSEFNTDLNYPWPYSTMKAWQEAGQQNPAVWTTWNRIWASEQPLKDWLRGASGTEWDDPVPSSVDEPSIPPMQILPTFTNLQQWLDGLTADQRIRPATAMRNRA